MTGPDAQATFAAVLVDEWVRAGVTDAVVAPGSRSTPLLVALDADGRLRIHVLLDERSAGFFGVGLGLCGRPALVVTTSGTAAVELHPAVVEADQAGVPLVAVTADRPAELHGVGAPQTVEQEGLFGAAVRWAASPGVADSTSSSWWRSLASRVIAESLFGPAGPGPVHLNLAFREPLLGQARELPPGRLHGQPWHTVVAADGAPPEYIVDRLAGLAGRRGLIVAGAGLEAAGFGASGAGLGGAGSRPGRSGTAASGAAGACLGGAGLGPAGSGPAGGGLGGAEMGPAGFGSARVGLAEAGGSGGAGSGVAGSGVAGSGVAGSGVAGSGSAAVGTGAMVGGGGTGADAGLEGEAAAAVGGGGIGDGAAASSVQAMATALGWPVLADPRSGCRVPGRLTVASADALLRVPELAAWRPEVVVRIGQPWASKTLSGWLGQLSPAVEQVLVDPFGRWADPERTAATVLRCSAAGLGQAVAEQTRARFAPSGDREWARQWAMVEGVAQRAIDEVLANHPEVTEPGVARSLVGGVPSGTTVFVSSSMPVRDVEWWSRPRTGVQILANRGANGIDGIVSTALGVAAAGPGPVVALVGDLAFLYDAGALLWAVERGVDCTFVVVDNNGGGIFSFLPQAATVAEATFERLWGTPHRIDLGRLAGGYGVPVTTTEKSSLVSPIVNAAVASGGVRIVHVRTDRRDNVAVHAELVAAVAAAVGKALARLR